MMKMYGMMNPKEYVELGECKSKIGAWLIKRKYKNLKFERVFVASKPEEVPIEGCVKVYKLN